METPATSAGPGPAGPSAAAPPPAELFAVLTMQAVTPKGIQTTTKCATVTVQPHVTRKGLFENLRHEFPEHFHQNGTVLFFSAEPNQLTAG